MLEIKYTLQSTSCHAGYWQMLTIFAYTDIERFNQSISCTLIFFFLYTCTTIVKCILYVFPIVTFSKVYLTLAYYLIRLYKTGGPFNLSVKSWSHKYVIISMAPYLFWFVCSFWFVFGLLFLVCFFALVSIFVLGCRLLFMKHTHTHTKLNLPILRKDKNKKHIRKISNHKNKS